MISNGAIESAANPEPRSNSFAGGLSLVLPLVAHQTNGSVLAGCQAVLLAALTSIASGSTSSSSRKAETAL